MSNNAVNKEWFGPVEESWLGSEKQKKKMSMKW